MTREIERKWLCRDWPADLPYEQDWEVEQAYLYVGDDVEVRLHKKVDRHGRTDTNYRMTTKIGNGLERIELSVYLTEKQYNEFMTEVVGVPINKHFRTFNLNGYELGIGSILEGNNIFYAEIEFDSQEEANAFILPYDWEEVTGDINHNMKTYWRNTRQNKI